MSKGFFSLSQLNTKVGDSDQRVSRCGTCGLYKHCKSPKMPPTGKGRKKILMVAEAPGKMEDEKNTQLIGKAGQRLREHLRKFHIDLDRDCWKTNAVICRREGNEKPTGDMIRACRPNLLKTIHKFDPSVIFLLGGVSIESLISYLWKDDVGGVSRWGGYSIPCQSLNCWIVPTFHPSFLLRSNNPALDVLFSKHLSLGLNKTTRPWKKIPDYRNEVEIIYRPSGVVKIIREMIRRGGRVSIDYETNCLKPETEGAEIVSCSVSWEGKKTISFMWENSIVEIISELWKSPLYKIASNIKFEDRWTRKILGHGIRNWWWDTMLASHIINPSPGATGLKFQSFVLFGVEDYDSHIKPYLRLSKKRRLNRIREVDPKELLLYGGLDSLLEYKVAKVQRKQLGYGSGS